MSSYALGFHFSNVVTFPKKSALKKAPRTCGAFFYFLRPEPEPEGASVEPLGEALGPSVFPDGL
jgi:hypothetical protein